MRLGEDEIRTLISAALVAYMVVVASFLWFIDLIAKQGEFGAIFATELLGFAMLVYVSTKPNYGEVKTLWLLVGCLATAFFLVVALVQ